MGWSVFSNEVRSIQVSLKLLLANYEGIAVVPTFLHLRRVVHVERPISRHLELLGLTVRSYRLGPIVKPLECNDGKVLR